MKEPLWCPTHERIEQSNMSRFLAYAEKRTGGAFASYDALYQWSISDIESFWEAVWQFGEIIHSQPYSRVLSERTMPGAKWFEGARLNFARNLLRHRHARPAIIAQREAEPPTQISYDELHRLVAKCAHGLRELGIGPGDRVAAYVSNIPEAVIAMLAVTSIGAVWSSCSPDFGLQGAVDRFGQITPKVLISVDRYVYQGKTVELTDRVQHLVEKIPQISKVVVIPSSSDFGTTDINRAIDWQTLLDNNAADIEFAELPFDHPVYILYSSGTTGIPKCMVHGGGGTLVQHYKELALHTDLRHEDTIFYYTTCGWMMWNWLVSSLMVGATVYLYDGSPSYPNIEVLWQAIEQQKISIFGTSPRFLTACQHARLIPKRDFDLSSLRTILSTGSPLSSDNFEWVYKNVKSDLQLSSISGGTDIISCFMLGNPLLPVFSEEIQCRGLGMKVEAYDDNGRPVIEETGELVCTAPFPSMPSYFWNDPDGFKYRSAYFEVFPGVWRHGDFIRITENGGVVVYGRSDATLNPGGVRIGTAEIYNAVEAMPEISDSIVVAQRWNHDVRVVLFVVTAEGIELDEALKSRIRETIRNHATPRHVPAVVLPIREVPRTLNGKKVEVAVTRVIHGEKVPNSESLANPRSLDQFVNIAALG
ncbi:MAG: acetoacetate--CoA ligase [Candidatus Zixiibacteriota bacterium]